MGVVGRMGAGVYADTSGQNLLTEGGLTVKASSGDLAVGLEADLTRAAHGDTVAYWSAQGQLTATLGLPAYIIR